MTNEEYVQAITQDVEAQKKVLAVLATYGNNRWWLSADARVRAYYQLHEHIQVLPDFSQFHDDLEKLLGRPVWTHEFAVNIEQLRQEAQKAWQGTLPTPEERQHNAEHGIASLWKAIE